jgi:hypothetical protein
MVTTAGFTGFQGEASTAVGAGGAPSTVVAIITGGTLAGTAGGASSMVVVAHVRIVTLTTVGVLATGVATSMLVLAIGVATSTKVEVGTGDALMLVVAGTRAA